MDLNKGRLNNTEERKREIIPLTVRHHLKEDPRNRSKSKSDKQLRTSFPTV